MESAQSSNPDLSYEIGAGGTLEQMDTYNEGAIKQLKSLMEEVDESLKQTFQNVHQGCVRETLIRFLKARDWNVDKTHKMLLECLNWRVQNDIDNILSKPIIPSDLYRSIRESQLIGLGVSGYSKEGDQAPPFHRKSPQFEMNDPHLEESLVLLAELTVVAQHNPTAVLDLIMPRERARWGASSSLSAAQSNPIHTRSSSDSALQTEAREQKYNYKFEKTRQENASKESSVSVETDVSVPPSQTSDVQGISAPMPAQPQGTEIELQNYDPTSRKLDNAVVDIPPAQVTGETQAIKKYTNCILQEANGESIIPTMAINVLGVVDGAVFTLAGTGLQDQSLKGMPKLCLKIVLGLLGPSLTCLFCLGAFHGKLPPRFRAPATYVALACNAAAFFLLLAFFIVN